MSDLVTRLNSLTRGRSPHPVAAPLAFDWRASCSAPPFSFGVPFPWEGGPDAPLDQDEPPVLHLVVRRRDGLVPACALWFEADGPDVATADARPLIQAVSTSDQSRCVGTWKVLLAGARANVYVFVSATDLLLHLVVNHGNGLLQAQFRLPVAFALGYLPHVETMLGTWDWVP